MHLHADAWLLTEEGVREIISDMNAAGASIAFPGKTKTFVERYPPGAMEDQFILFDADAANSVDLLERSCLDFPPGFSIHYILPMIFIVKLGWGEIYHYSSSDDREFWDGEKAIRARPMFFREPYDQVHIAKEDFVDDLGKSLQMYYLQQYGLDEGEMITQYINEYQMEESLLFLELDQYLQNLDQELSRYGFHVDDFERDIRQIRRFLNDSRRSKAALFWDRKIKNRIKSTLRTVAATAGVVDRTTSTGSQYNGSVHEYYENLLVESDYPEDLTEEYKNSFGPKN
jgi:hypothetical protein